MAVILLGDIAESDLAYCTDNYRSVDCLFVCFLCSCIVLNSNGWRYWHDFFCVREHHISPAPRLLKIWLTSVNPFLAKFCPKVNHHIWASENEWLEIGSQLSQWTAHTKPPSPTPYDLTSIKWGPNNQDQLRNACFQLANMIEDIDLDFCCIRQPHRAMSRWGLSRGAHCSIIVSDLW